MADLAASAVSLYPTDSSGEYYPQGKDNRAVIARRLKLVLTGQGLTTTSTITAASLGLGKILTASTLWDATNNKGYPTAVDPVNNIVVLLDGSAAPAPTGVTSTATYITVTGTFVSPVTAP